jgi:hypothetical protein
VDILTGIKQFERIEPYYKQKHERKKYREIKGQKKINKRNRQNKTYKEIVMEKQANTGKIEKKKKKKRKNRENKL